MADGIRLMSRSDKRMARITNSNDLVELYENVHHLLWTREGFSPEKAMDHLNLFLYLMCIEPQIDAGNITLPECCRFSYLAKIEDENILFDVIKKKVQLEINKNPVTKDYFTRIEIQYPETVFNLIKHLNRIDLTIDDKDFLGGIYEYIIGRGMTTMSDDGQYFTERQICRYAMALSDIKPGVVHTMIDPFCGTGGFITEYVKTVQKGIEDKVGFWKENSKHIFGNDIKVSSVMSTLLNLIFVTGVSFSKDNVIHKNSLYESLFNGKKFKYIFTNPPFGGDKSKGDDFKFKYGDYIKGKPKKQENYQYKVSEEIQAIGIRIDDKVAAAVQLCMAMLDEGGTCGIVLPEGFFFQSGKQLIELRKNLIEEYNVKHIVDIPQGVFENTSTKTCLMIFSKDNKTSEVEFIDFLKRNDEKRTLVKVSLDELKEKNYSLNYKRYVKQAWNVGNDYVIYNFNEILDYFKAGKNKTPDNKQGTKYPYYGTSAITGYTDHFLEDGEYILTARNGSIGNVMLVTGKSWPSDHMFTIRTKENVCLLKYLYYWMINQKDNINKKGLTTTIPGITKEVLGEIEIPLPSIEKQKEIIEEIDNYAVRASKMKDLVKDMEKGLMYAVRRMTLRNDCTMFHFNEIVRIHNGKRIVKKRVNSGDIPVYGGGDASFFTDIHNREGFNCKISREGMSLDNCVQMIYGNFYMNSQGMTITSKDENVCLSAFLWYFILGNKHLVYDCGRGTAQKAIDMQDFGNIELRLPPINIQHDILEDFKALTVIHDRIHCWGKQSATLISQMT